MTKLHPICTIASFETIKANMKKIILATILSLGSFSAWAVKVPSSAQCLGRALYMEARGESAKVKKAVMQTIINRSKIDKMSICKVILKKLQFPWSSRVTSWKLTQEQMEMLFEIVQMRPVVNSRVYYFNHVKMSWGRKHRKRGRMWFAEKEINFN